MFLGMSLLTHAIALPSSSEVTGTLSTGLGNSSVSGIVVAAPVATPGTGSYTSTQTVALTAEGSLSIHYTVDGTTATCATGNTYSTPITVASSQTISAISCYANSVSSSVSSNVYTISTVVSGGGGGGGGGGISDTTPPTNTSISINSGAASTASLSVRLTLAATDATYMIISNDAGFAGAEWEAYAVSKSWTLVSGDGVKTVYAKFRDSSNNMSMAVSDTILVTGSLTTAPLATNIPTQGCSGGNKYNTSTGELCINNTAPRGQVLGASTSLFNRDLRVGSRGDDVMELQKILIAGGFLKGDATGYFGPLTATALTKWQIKNGLTVSQTFGMSARNFLNASLTNKPTSVIATTTVIFVQDLRLGVRGNEVMALQKILIADKFLNVFPPTNYFGIMTQNALKKWQAKNGLPITGRLDAASRLFLNSVR